MARTWLSITVELLGGRGQELWPWPGRIMTVGPSHTFRQLAESINTAFARWDLAHLSMFTLADGRIITDADTADEMVSTPWGSIPDTLDIDTVVVARTVERGDEFRFVFDLGDDWTHRCVVGAEKVDPMVELGIRPRAPLPSWGWGTIPDQYGRRYDGDIHDGPTPRRPRGRHPMLSPHWPEAHRSEPLDMTEVRAAIATADASRFLASLVGRDLDDALQQIGLGLPMAIAQEPDRAAPVASGILNRLITRAWPGDEVLADDLVALLRGVPLPGRPLPVDLAELSGILESGTNSEGGYLDLRTGEVWAADATDPLMVGEDAAIDVDTDPDRWLVLAPNGSRAAWTDMADFAASRTDADLRVRIEQAIEGRGAFRRFRDVVSDEGLVDQWRLFSIDRQLGRARAELAHQGIRVGG